MLYLDGNRVKVLGLIIKMKNILVRAILNKAGNSLKRWMLRRLTRN